MKCPICDRDTIWKGNPTRPFCSERCQTIDLGRWANEDYAVPAENAPASAEMMEDPSIDRDEPGYVN